MERTCLTCGVTIELRPHNVIKGKKFCSYSCSNSFTKKGASNASWDGGDEYYWKRMARERDNHTCRFVGCPVAGEGQKLAAHHIIPKSAGGSDDLSNLITLCPSHHKLVERKLLTWVLGNHPNITTEILISLYHAILDPIPSLATPVMNTAVNVEKPCGFCRKELPPSVPTSGRRFCSKECGALYYENLPYKYRGNITQCKKEARKRDGGLCRYKDCTVIPNGFNMHAHHKIPRSSGGSDGLDNLITLCATHHFQMERQLLKTVVKEHIPLIKTAIFSIYKEVDKLHGIGLYGIDPAVPEPALKSQPETQTPQ